jgi:hypothetical protein
MRHLTASQKIAQLENRIAHLEKQASNLSFLKDIEKVFEDKGHMVDFIKKEESHTHGGTHFNYELTDSQGREANMQVEVIGPDVSGVTVRVGYYKLTYKENPKRVARVLQRELRKSENLRFLDRIFI